MKIHDLIILDEFNQFKTLVEDRHGRVGYLIFNANDIHYIYDDTKSYDECRLLMKIWIHYGLVEDFFYYGKNRIGLVIKIDF
jgi:hypothetical protein